MSRVGSVASVIALGLSLLGTTPAASADDEPGVELRGYDLPDLATAWSSDGLDDAVDVPRAWGDGLTLPMSPLALGAPFAYPPTGPVDFPVWTASSWVEATTDALGVLLEAIFDRVVEGGPECSAMEGPGGVLLVRAGPAVQSRVQGFLRRLDHAASPTLFVDIALVPPDALETVAKSNGLSRESMRLPGELLEEAFLAAGERGSLLSGRIREGRWTTLRLGLSAQPELRRARQGPRDGLG